MLISLPLSFTLIALQSVARDFIFAHVAAGASITARIFSEAEKQEIANYGFYHMESPNLSTFNYLLVPPLASDAAIANACVTQ